MSAANHHLDELEPIFDDDVSTDGPAVAAPRSRRGARVVIVVLSAAVLAAGATAVVMQRRLDAAEREVAAARVSAAERLAAKDREMREAVEAAALGETRRDEAEHRRTANEVLAAKGDEFVLRDPIVTFPASTRLCTADDVRLIGPPEPTFLMFANRSGRPCGLVDHPIAQGLDKAGRWRTIPVQPSPGSSYSDGAMWTGMFHPGSAAVLSILGQAPLETSGLCPTGDAPREEFVAVRLILQAQSRPLELPGVTLQIGPCRPKVMLWAYDHAGA